MKISLIGTSGTGKSHWAELLQRQYNFTRFCIDDLIEQKLENELSEHNISGINGVAKWMGMPFEQRFKENEKKYLDAELSAMLEVLDQVRNFDQAANIVIDTTGSAIYMGEAVCNELRRLTTVVYLDVSEEFEEKMFAEFVANPKPVIWAHSYNKLINESDIESLHRCYPELLHYRSSFYKQYADVVIPYEVHKEGNLTAEEFLQKVAQS